MKIFIYFVTLSLILSILYPLTTQASCTDPPKSGVNWERCNFSEKTLSKKKT